MRIDVDIADLERLRRAYAQAPDITQKEMLAFLRTVAPHLEGEVKARTPTAHGTLRASITSAVSPLAGGLGAEAVIGTSHAYAIPVELGSKPHFPPVDAIEDWVAVKLGIGGAEGRRVAFAIARSIAQRGTLAVGMFHRTVAANREQVARGFAVAVDRIAARIAVAGGTP